MSSADGIDRGKRPGDVPVARLPQTGQGLQALLEHIPDCIARFDAECRYVFVSPAVTRLFDLPPEQFIGKRLSETGKPSGQAQDARLEAMIRRAFEEGRSNSCEAQWTTAEGERFFEVLHVPERDEDGCIVSVLGIAHDITQRKLAEQALRESESFLQALLDAMPIPVFYKDRQGRYLGFNQAYEAFFGATRDQLVGKSVFDISPRELAQIYYAKDNELFTDGGVQCYEAQVKSWQGDLREVVFNKALFADGEGAAKGLVGAILDVTERKRAENELRTSEARFRTFADHAMDAFFLQGEGGVVLDVNRQACLSLGYTREELIGMSPADFDADLPDEARTALRARLDQGETVTFESHHRRKDGSLFPVEVRLRPFVDGGRQMYIGLVRDISERERVEEDLRRLNRELRAISRCHQTLLRANDEKSLLEDICRIICDEAGYRMAWVGYAEHDEAKTVRPVAWAGGGGEYLLSTRISWAEESEYGQGPAAVSIRSGRIVHIQDITTDRGMMPWHDRALERGYRTCVSLPLKDMDARVFGALLIYSSEPDAITPEEIRLMEDLSHDLAFGIDVLRTREERRQAEEKYRTIFENSPLGIFRSMAEGRFVELNPAMAHMLGHDSPESVMREIHDIGRQVYAEGYDREDVVRAQLSAGDDATQYMSRFRRRDGNEFDATVYLKTVRNAEGEPVMFDGIVEDATERLQAESERERLQAQLLQAQKMESVGRLAGGIAHDFNNMLAAIMGYAELAMQDVDSGQRLIVHLKEIHKAASRSADLTRQLLGFARKQPALPAVLDLNHTVEGMLKMLRRLIGEDIQLRWLPGKALHPIRVDPSQIDQVLANLCVNARDAIHDVGAITIETRSAHLDRAYCAEHPWAEVGDYVLLAVCDDGSGMDPETLDKVFEPFFTTKEVGQGTGLGLAMVYGIVKQNEGFIDIQSQRGRGTRVEIYLPQHASAAEVDVEAAEEMAEEALSCGSETILLAEDEPVVLDMAKLMLEECGYRVLAASTPEKAVHLAKVHAGEIGLLVTDVVMPEMNGHDLSVMLTSLYPGIRTLFMSGYPGNAIAQHGVPQQGVNFIQKPFTFEALAAKVRGVLDAQ